MKREIVGEKGIVVQENYQVLINSIKSKAKCLSFSSSEIASLTGYHPYCNIIELFLKYLYQNMELLYELDCQFLQIQNISTEEEIHRIISKFSVEKQQEIKHLQSTVIEDSSKLTNSKQVQSLLEISKQLLKPAAETAASTTLVSSAITASEVAVKENELLKKEEIEFLENELFYRIKTNYGKFNEEKALNQYEEITGFNIVERNDTLYVLEVPSPVVDLSSTVDSLTGPPQIPSDSPVSVQMPIVENSCNEVSSSNSELSGSLSGCVERKEIVCIDLLDDRTDDDISAESPIPDNVVVTSEVISTTTTMTVHNDSHFAVKKSITDYFTQTKRSLPTSSSSTTTSYETISSTSVDDKMKSEVKSKRQKKSSNSSFSTSTSSSSKQPIAFCIIGKVDGISYQLDTSSDDVNQWKEMKIVIEMKNRVKRIFTPPPLYEQIQLVSYLIMTGCQYGDLVQVLPEEEENVDDQQAIEATAPSQPKDEGTSTCTSVQSDKESYLKPVSWNSSNYSITRITLDGSPYHHRYHWDTAIIPRLHIFKDAIQSLRKDDELRYSFLLGSDEERLLLIYHLCPYFTM
jgi:hypothetical protein